MKIQLNGSDHLLESTCSIAQLIEQLGYTNKRVAIEVNGNIIPRGLHASTQIQDQDVIEIVVAVGGG